MAMSASMHGSSDLHANVAAYLPEVHDPDSVGEDVLRPPPDSSGGCVVGGCVDPHAICDDSILWPLREAGSSCTRLCCLADACGGSGTHDCGLTVRVHVMWRRPRRHHGSQWNIVLSVRVFRRHASRGGFGYAAHVCSIAVLERFATADAVTSAHAMEQ